MTEPMLLTLVAAGATFLTVPLAYVFGRRATLDDRFIGAVEDIATIAAEVRTHGERLARLETWRDNSGVK